MKLEDADYDERNIRKLFIQKFREYNRVTIKGSPVDVDFKRIMKVEVEAVWVRGKTKNKEKVKRLVEKYAPDDATENIRDIEFTGDRLRMFSESNQKEVKKYDGVILTEIQESALRMDPKFMLYKQITEIDIEVEIEKGCTKARYCLMNEINNNDENGNNTENNNNDNNRGFKVFDLEKKMSDYGNIRATDIPTVQRLYPPKPASIRREVIMQNVKDKMLNKVQEYKEEHCNDKGWLKKYNISKAKSEGLKEVRDRVKQKEIVVFTTDKTGEFTVDTAAYYEEALIEGLRKTHKAEVPGMEVRGPRV